MYLVHTPDGIALDIKYCITCLKLLFSKLTSTGLYLEGRLLDMCTGAPDWPRAKM